MKCKFTSVWSDGSVITTPGSYNTKTGHVSAVVSKRLPENSAILKHEFISVPVVPGKINEEFMVCPQCHEYVLRPVMIETTGKQLSEGFECRNPECKE